MPIQGAHSLVPSCPSPFSKIAIPHPVILPYEQSLGRLGQQQQGGGQGRAGEGKDGQERECRVEERMSGVVQSSAFLVLHREALGAE